MNNAEIAQPFAEFSAKLDAHKIGKLWISMPRRLLKSLEAEHAA